MFSWLFIITIAYLFFSLSSLGDKLILKTKIYPKLYLFYTGFSSIFMVVLIPFVPFGLPSMESLPWIFLEPITFLGGLYFMYVALEKYDSSKAVPVIGAIQPMVIFFISWLFFGALVNVTDILALLILVLGTILISFDKKLNITADFLTLTGISGLMFSLDYIFLKLLFLHQPFFQGLIWTRMVIFVLILGLLFDSDIRKQIFKKGNIINKKNIFLFFFVQCMGGTAILFQNLAISLSPISYLSLVNGLRGIEYVFLFIITLCFSLFFPKILKEEVTRITLARKVLGLLFIVAGLCILLFF